MVGFLLGLAWLAWVAVLPASAQTRQAQAPISRSDVYRNARPSQAARRSLGIYQNPVQRQALTVYQGAGRRGDRRGGVSGFSLLGDRRGSVRPGVAASLANLLPVQPVGSSLGRALARFQGLDRPVDRRAPGNVASAFTRRRHLIGASSWNAPVYRALLRDSAMARTRTTIERTPFVPGKEMEKTETALGPSKTLDVWLQERIALKRQRIRGQAWGWFQRESFQRASGAFDTAVMLEPSDSESRIGEMFCRLMLEARRSALAEFNALVSREANVFEQRFTETRTPRISEAFGDAKRAGRLRMRAQTRVGLGESNPNVRAMYILVLWYLGQATDAQRAAEQLAREPSGSRYAGWPAQMRAASVSIDAGP